MLSITDPNAIFAPLHVNTNHRLRLCGLWQPCGSIKGGPCSENQRHTGPDGQGEVVAGMRVCVCVWLGGWVDTCVWVCLPMNMSDGLCLFNACMCTIRVRRMTDWSHDLSSQAVPPATPFIFQMSRFPLPNNLSFSVPCYSEDHHLAHQQHPVLKRRLLQISYDLTYAYVNVMSASGHRGNHSSHNNTHRIR